MNNQNFNSEASGKAEPTVAPLDLHIRGAQLVAFENITANGIESIGGKAKNLVTMYQAGLPVPAGYCVTYESYIDYSKSGEINTHLIDEIVDAKAKLGGKVAIRSSGNCEDGSELSMAGVFETFYVEDDASIVDAVKAIYEQASSETVKEFMQLHDKTTDNLQMGLVVQELIDPEISGVVYTDVNDAELLVQYVDGFGSKLVDGEAQGSTILIDKHGVITSSSGYQRLRPADELPEKILELSTTIKDLFGDNQDIEFAYDDSDVFILQARPLTAKLDKIELRDTPEETLDLTKRHLHDLVEQEKREFGIDSSVFSDANYSELLPRPTEMDIGIHMYVWGGSDKVPGAKQIGHKEMGYLVPPEATGVIQYIGGRTYFSIARNAALYHTGFPETKAEYFSSLVAEYLETAQADPERAAYPQMGLFLQDPTMEDLQQRFGDKAEEYLQVYKDFSDTLRGFADSFVDEFYEEINPETEAFIAEVSAVNIDTLSDSELVSYTTDILEHVRTKSYIGFVKGARLGFYYSQRLQSLLKDLLETDDVNNVFSMLSQGLNGSAITDSNLAIAEAPSFDEAYKLAESTVGHYSAGEMLEIRHERLIDNQKKLAAYVSGIRSSGTYAINFEQQKAARMKAQADLLDRFEGPKRDELERAISYSQTYMSLRETAKYQFTREYGPLKKGLEAIGDRIGLEQGDIYFVYPRELGELVNDPSAMRHVIKSRKQAFENYAALEMPSVIFGDDIDNLKLSDNNNENFVRAIGKFLAAGKAHEGTVVNVDEFEDTTEILEAITKYKQLGHEVILAAQQMNLSHDPLIAQSSGLIIENAGIVAHGAQRARELGKGAIGGIHVKSLSTGMKILFDPSDKLVEKIEG
jgi:phosphohistidine swiveling domain-containing protein